MTLVEYLRVLRERWFVVVLCLGLGLTGAGLAIFQSPYEYEAKVTLFISAQAPASDISAAYQGSLLSEQRIKSYSELIVSPRITRDVIANLGLPMSQAELADHIAVSNAPNTVILEAAVTDESPERAAAIANTVAASFVKLVAELEQPPDGRSQPSVTARIVDPATAPLAPSSPRPLVNLALGAIIGCVIGIGAAFLRNVTDTSIKSKDQLREAVNAPCLGTVAYDIDVPQRPLVVHDDPQAPQSESFRQIRTNLQFVDVDHQPLIIVITSSVSNEGKTTIACNLALALADADKKVLLIEADLRRPRVSDYLGIDRPVGLTSVLAGRASLTEAVRAWHGSSLHVLPSGPIPPNPSELLGSQNMAQVLNDVRGFYDMIFIDTPPLLPVTDAAAVAPHTDGVIMVVRHGRTARHQVETAGKALEAVSARLLGTVISMVPPKGVSDYGGYHSYYRSDDFSGPRPAATLSQPTRVSFPSDPSATPPRTPAQQSPATRRPLPSPTPRNGSPVANQGGTTPNGSAAGRADGQPDRPGKPGKPDKPVQRGRPPRAVPPGPAD